MQYYFIMITHRTLTTKNEVINEVLYDRLLLSLVQKALRDFFIQISKISKIYQTDFYYIQKTQIFSK